MRRTIHPVILCGGAGTRLWPLSTPARPKQFLPLISAQSMIADTAARVAGSRDERIRFGDLIVVGANSHEAELDAALPGARKILEPVGRNSAPAIAAASLIFDPDDLVLILPADHSIGDVDAFHRAIAMATDAAIDGAIVTFGITPDYPATEYGYIKARPDISAERPVRVEKFVEKPDLETARSYLESGSYCWNAGIFLVKAAIMRDALRTHAPTVLGAAKAALPMTQTHRIALDRAAFEQAPSISIDYAVMEQAENIETIAVDMGWNDVGSFAALHTARRGRQSQMPRLVQQTRAWLWQMLDHWVERAWDCERGGFVEQLDITGAPDRTADRRVRVQARQVFSFAKATEIGWPGAEKARHLIERGIAHLDQNLRHPDGGWMHKTRPDGTPVETRRDLYDHAFIVFAGAQAYKTCHLPEALKIAQDALEVIDGPFVDSKHGGWLESLPAVHPRRSDTHMHLLEATIAYYRITGCETARARATRIVDLFKTRFFHRETDVLAEYFGADWRPLNAEDDIIFQGGHHYEWASLLAMYDAVTGNDTLDLRHRLIARADATARDPACGFAHNAVRVNGTIVNSNRRLWHQLEMLRAYLLHPNLDVATPPDALLNAILQTYLRPGPSGGWIDETDANGAPLSTVIPASMLYHLLTCLSPVIGGKL